MCYRPKTFFCHSLRTGGYALGWLGVLTSITGLFEAYAGLVLSSNYRFNAGGVGINVFSLIVVLITITVDGLLIHGTKEGNRKFLLPWLIWHCMGLVLVGLSVILLMIFVNLNLSDFDPEVQRMVHTIGKLAVGVLWAIFVIGIYLWQCILALYRAMENGDFIAPANIAMTSVHRMDQEAGRPLYPSPYVNKQ